MYRNSVLDWKWQDTFHAFDILTFTTKCVTHMRLLWKRLVETQARAPRAIWSSTSCSSFASFLAPTWFFSSWYLAKWLRTWSPSSSCICAELLWQNDFHTLGYHDHGEHDLWIFWECFSPSIHAESHLLVEKIRRKMANQPHQDLNSCEKCQGLVPQTSQPWLCRIFFGGAWLIVSLLIFSERWMYHKDKALYFQQAESLLSLSLLACHDLNLSKDWTWLSESTAICTCWNT